MNWIPVIQPGDFKNTLLKIERILKQQKSKFINNPGLMGGQIGVAIFFFYYAKLMDKQEPYDYGMELLSSVFDRINKGFHFHTHASGLAGIGSSIELLVENDFLEADTNELLGELDDYLNDRMIQEIKNGHYDFLHGAVGIGFYFLKRKLNVNSRKYLTDLVHELDKISITDEQGIRWVSTISREKNTKVNNLSLSHGLASIIAFLGKLNNEDIAKEKVNELLNGSVKYLLNQQLDITKYSSNLPSWVCETEPSVYSRLAWCYGDLGIGNALWLAGNNANNEKWKEEAIEILLHTTTRREDKNTGVVDAGLCHGTAGIAHIYNRMYNYTAINEFKNSSAYWLTQTLAMAKYKDTLSGYKVFRTAEYGGPYEDFGFLEGIAGIGLALISAISDVEPAWDECLLLS